MDEKVDEPLAVVLRVLPDDTLRHLVVYCLNEQRRRMKFTLAKCKSRTQDGLPNIIFKRLEEERQANEK